MVPKWACGLVVLISILTAISGCAADRSAAHRPTFLERFEYSSIVMGVQARIILYAEDEDEALASARAAFARLNELDQILSDWRHDSDLNLLCRAAANQPRQVRPELLAVLGHAQALARETGGAFDITAGALTHIWRDARNRGGGSGDLDAEAIQDARRRVGPHLLSVDEAAGRITLHREGMQLDLGGIAKGYSACEALRVLRERGTSHAMIALAGDLAIGEPPPGREGWTIKVFPGIGNGSPRPATEERLVLANAAVSTSGDLEQYMIIDGVRHSHIIDPRTGRPLTEQRAVTVIAPRGIDADSIATAASILDTEAALQLAARRQASMLLRWVKNGEVHEVRTGRFLR